MVGAVGADGDGDTLLADLRRDGIDVAGIRRLEGHPTGVALITIDARCREHHRRRRRGQRRRRADGRTATPSAPPTSSSPSWRSRSGSSPTARGRAPGRSAASSSTPRRPRLSSPSCRRRSTCSWSTSTRRSSSLRLADVDDAVRRLLDDVPGGPRHPRRHGARLVSRDGARRPGRVAEGRPRPTPWRPATPSVACTRRRSRRASTSASASNGPAPQRLSRSSGPAPRRPYRPRRRSTAGPRGLRRDAWLTTSTRWSPARSTSLARCRSSRTPTSRSSTAARSSPPPTTRPTGRAGASSSSAGGPRPASGTAFDDSLYHRPELAWASRVLRHQPGVAVGRAALRLGVAPVHARAAAGRRA